MFQLRCQRIAGDVDVRMRSDVAISWAGFRTSIHHFAVMIRITVHGDWLDLMYRHIVPILIRCIFV